MKNGHSLGGDDLTCEKNEVDQQKMRLTVTNNKHRLGKSWPLTGTIGNSLLQQVETMAGVHCLDEEDAIKS